MTIPRAVPVIAIVLFLIVAATVALLWSQGGLRHPSEDVRSGGGPAACAPLDQNGPPPAECPQAQPSSQRAP